MLSERIIQYIENMYVIEEKQKEILKFGIQSSLEIGLNIIVSMIALCLLHMFWKGIFFFLVFIPLRTYSGGYHADTYLRCLFFSTGTLVLVMLISKYTELAYGTMLLFLIILSIVIWRIAPVINTERPVSMREYQKFVRKLKIVLVLELILAALLVFFQKRELLNVLWLSWTLVCITLWMGKRKYQQATN